MPSAEVTPAIARVLLAIAHHGDPEAAAGELGSATDTVLRQLDDLERRLGAKLFERRVERFEATQDGRIVLGRATRALSALDEALAHIAEVGGTAPAFRVVESPAGIARRALAGMQRALEREAVALTLYARDTAEAGLALVADARGGRRRRRRLLLGAWGRSDRRLSDALRRGPTGGERARRPAADRRSAPWAGSRAAATRSVVRSAIEATSGTLEATLEEDRLPVLIELVAAGIGATIIPVSALPPEDDRRVVVGELHGRPPMLGIVLVASPHAPAGPLAGLRDDLARHADLTR